MSRLCDALFSRIGFWPRPARSLSLTWASALWMPGTGVVSPAAPNSFASPDKPRDSPSGLPLEPRLWEAFCFTDWAFLPGQSVNCVYSWSTKGPDGPGGHTSAAEQSLSPQRRDILPSLPGPTFSLTRMMAPASTVTFPEPSALGGLGLGVRLAWVQTTAPLSSSATLAK